MQADGGLLAAIRDEIGRQGVMRFDRFMALALYAPDGGYYTRREARIGRQGDFVTSPSLAPAFGRTLARLLPLLAGSGPLRVIDAGSGEGHLLAALAAAAPRDIEAVVVERGDDLRRRAVARLEALGVRVAAVRDTVELAGLPAAPGLVLANEIFDALPVRRLRQGRHGPEEAYVGLGSDPLVELWLEVEPQPPADDLPPGREVSFAPGLPELLAELSGGIARGLLLIIDYGYPRGRIRGEEGTGNPVRGFRGGTLAANILERPGEVDLTAHVDFSALHSAALDLGLTPLFFTAQTYLLLALGFLDDRDAAAAKRLIHPEDMGGAFQVLALGHGLDRKTVASLAVRDHLHQLRT